jgi:hypothetical protein
MNVFRFVKTAVCVALLVSASNAVARAQGAAAQVAGPRYDKSTEVVTSGTIESIQMEKSATPLGTYIVLKAAPLTLNVHMGLYSANSIPFKAGDSVQVTGSLITVDGKQILLARHVQSATQSITVRGPMGIVHRPTEPVAVQGGQQ